MRKLRRGRRSRLRVAVIAGRATRSRLLVSPGVMRGCRGGRGGGEGSDALAQGGTEGRVGKALFHWASGTEAKSSLSERTLRYWLPSTPSPAGYSLPRLEHARSVHPNP